MVVIPHIYHLLPGFLMHGSLPPQCTKPLNMSNSKSCTNKPELKFHFDALTGFCMNFLWDGCSEMENKFDTLAECASNCLKDSYKGCPFRRNPVVLQLCYNNKSCNRRKSKNPNLLYCTARGICCETEDLEELRSVFNVTCLSKSQKVQYTYKSTMRLLIGKNCDSKMCPFNSTCHQTKYFAFCCK